MTELSRPQAIGRYLDGMTWSATARRALKTLAAGPMINIAGGFVPGSESICGERVFISNQTMEALRRRHAAKIIRRRRGHFIAALTPRGQAYASSLLAREADALTGEAAP